jgi:glycosyltransferase involved in cell wall biosynthesis
MKVKYTAALTDFSGYGSAARGYIKALNNAGIQVFCNPISFEPWKPSETIRETVGQEIFRLVRPVSNEDFHIIHLTPDLFKTKRSRSYSIGYYAWETSRIPSRWVEGVISMNEAWVPTLHNIEAAQKAGVKIPMFVLPHAIEDPIVTDNLPILKRIPDQDFKFYSIFQFSERKNPEALILAYLQEFSRDEPVILVLKTYWLTDSERDREYLRTQILSLKNQVNKRNHPKIILIDSMLTPIELEALHHKCHCYITTARGEGFGLPVFEAMARGNPVIAPRYSAFEEYLSPKRSYLLDVDSNYPVTGMGNFSSLYEGTMTWSNVEISTVRKAMREVFENQSRAKEIGAAGQSWVETNLSLEAIGTVMKSRLEAIPLSKKRMVR